LSFNYIPASADSEGGIPPDGSPVQVVVSFHLALVVTFYLIAAGVLIFCTVCLIFNFTQRKKKWDLMQPVLY